MNGRRISARRRPVANTGEAHHRRARSDCARRNQRDARGGGMRRFDPQAVRDRQRQGLRIVPPVPGRDRRPRGTPASCTTPVAEGHGRPHPDPAPRKAAARGDGTLHLRPPARLPDLQRQQRLRIAGQAARWACATCAMAMRARTTLGAATDASNPYFDFDPSQVHRLFALRARLRRSAGHASR
jgi:hypothetical protein